MRSQRCAGCRTIHRNRGSAADPSGFRTNLFTLENLQKLHVVLQMVLRGRRRRERRRGFCGPASDIGRTRNNAAFTAPTDVPSVDAVSSKELPRTSFRMSAPRCTGGRSTNTLERGFNQRGIHAIVLGLRAFRNFGNDVEIVALVTP